MEVKYWTQFTAIKLISQNKYYYVPTYYIPTLGTVCVLTCTNNECHLFSGKTKLDCVSTNNNLVESFEFLMEYFMTFCIKKNQTEKLKNSFTLQGIPLFGDH